jgi:hypothetical protein
MPAMRGEGSRAWWVTGAQHGLRVLCAWVAGWVDLRVGATVVSCQCASTHWQWTQTVRQTNTTGNTQPTRIANIYAAEVMDSPTFTSTSMDQTVWQRMLVHPGARATLYFHASTSAEAGG